MSRYEARLEKDMGEIQALFQDLVDRVETGLESAIRALLSGNEELAFHTVLGDEAINRLMRRIDRQCFAFIALHLPSAGHLRRIQAILRTNLQLERVGDYAVTISREAVQLDARPSSAVISELEMVANDGRRLLHQSLKAFMDGSDEVARATLELSGNAEATMDRIYGHLLDEQLEISIKDRVALFAVYNLLKRLWDQAKNICEETLFWVLGEVKHARTKRVLFVDRDNGCLSQMAEAVARKTHPERAEYSSAGVQPADSVDPGLISFMESRGIDLSEARPKPIGDEVKTLSNCYVVVSVDGPVRSHFPRLPFHTAGFSWDVGAAPNGADSAETERRFEELYRELALNVRELTDRLTGEGI